MRATLTRHHGGIPIFLFVALLLSTEALGESGVALRDQLEDERRRAGVLQRGTLFNSTPMLLQGVGAPLWLTRF